MSQRLEKLIDEQLSKDTKAPCYWWDSRWYTARDFLDLTDACERSLKKNGFKEGQRLVVLMKNAPLIPALSLAVWRLGGAICPLNVASGMESLTGTLRLIEPFAVVASDILKKDARAALEAEGHVCVSCPPEGPLPEFQGKLAGEESSDIAVIFATSGTTGLPKAAIIILISSFESILSKRAFSTFKIFPRNGKTA